MSDASFFCDNKDFLFAIWVFKTLGWSDRRIGRLLHTSNRTITSLKQRAYDYGGTFKLHTFAKGRRRFRIRYIGSTSKLEYLDAFLNQNICGGGMRKKPMRVKEYWYENGL